MSKEEQNQKRIRFKKEQIWKKADSGGKPVRFDEQERPSEV